MKGRPILGMLSGFFFGLFGGLTLFMYGAIPLHSPLIWILPLVGIVLGLAMAAWAPFGSGPQPAPATSESIGYEPAGDADPYQTSGTTLEQDVVEAPADHHADESDERGDTS